MNRPIQLGKKLGTNISLVFSKSPQIRPTWSTNPIYPITTVIPISILICRISSRKSVCNRKISTKDSTMDNDDKTTSTSATAASLNPNVDRMQQLLHSGSSGGWDKCWEEGITPWDLGKPTPVLVHLHQTGSLPKGRTLIPGCGSGYDVVTIACPERYVVGLDISDKAIERATKLSAPIQNAGHFTFLKEDFFTWQPSELFDLIFDYTFFCAIEPDMRSAWAIRVRDLLKPDGELITLMFPISDHVGGPPYKACVSDYEEVLQLVGFEAQSIVENDMAIGARKGKEKLGRWKKITGQSLL